jgi:predicted Zn-dependent protease
MGCARASPFLLPLVLAVACAINPVTRRPEFSRASRQAEARAGELEARRVEQELGILHDDELTAYVASVGARLARHSPRQDVDYRFLVVDSDIINAFAIPGGAIYVTRGLLVRLNREDELASVLGHEIGHLAAGHAVQRLTAAVPPAAGMQIPKAVAGLILPGLGRALDSLGQAANALSLAPYSGSQEMEADRLGQRIAAAAGWDPAALADFLHTLAREEALAGGERPGFFVRTHPLTQDRIDESRVRAAALPRAPHQPIAPTRLDFLKRLEGLLVGEDPAQGVLREGAFLQPDLDLWLAFPAGWMPQNGRDFVAAHSPDGAARVVLQLAAQKRAPLEVARDFAGQEGAVFGLLPVAVRLGRHAGARAYGHYQGATLDVSWIAKGDFVYQITGVCANGDYNVYQTPFIDVALSVRSLSAAERGEISELRLQIVRARAGEDLAELVERDQGGWSVEQVAIANALAVDAILEPDQPIKLPVARRYESPARAELSASPPGPAADSARPADGTARAPQS